MVAMGGYQGHISIATYNGDYIGYLDGSRDREAFMTLREYGPYDLRIFEEMKPFLIDIAILMRFSGL